MVNLQLPILPGRLHRYRSVTRAPEALAQEIDSILNNYIWCSSFARMNDPMEGLFRSSRLLKGTADYKARIKEIINTKSNTGIACFTERSDSVLMWAHYADAYKGICISYSATALDKGLSDAVRLVRLAYVDEPPLLYPRHAGNAADATAHILSQKRQEWAYEREWRVLAGEGRLALGHTAAIKRISFGLRIEKAHRDRILDSVRHTEIETFQMLVDNDGIGFEELEKPRPAKRKPKFGGKRKKAVGRKSSKGGKP